MAHAKFKVLRIAIGISCMFSGLTALSAMLLAGVPVNAMAADPAAQSASAVSGEATRSPVESWNRFSQALGAMGTEIHAFADGKRTTQQRAEINQTMNGMLSQGLLELYKTDPNYPDWVPFINNALLWGAPNPDSVYYATRLRGDGVYRIAGRRGSTRIVDIQVSGKNFGFDGHLDKTMANINLDDYKIEPDGSFEIILSEKRPDGYAGNWFRLDPKAGYLTVRQIANDWVHEEDAQFGIQRLDVKSPKKRFSSEQIDQALIQTVSYVDKWMRAMLNQERRRDTGDLLNQVKLFDVTSDSGGNLNQSYYSGKFRLAPEEALVLEVQPPKQCTYWGIQLMDRLVNSIPYDYHQSSLNGHTAKVDSDGKLRIVISQKDPGVPNWLDTVQYEEGYILGRYYRCAATPTPSIRKIMVSDIRKYIPADTPSVTPEQRWTAIQERVLGSQLRRRW